MSSANAAATASVYKRREFTRNLDFLFGRVAQIEINISMVPTKHQNVEAIWIAATLALVGPASRGKDPDRAYSLSKFMLRIAAK
jgi:hypothetical protein